MQQNPFKFYYSYQVVAVIAWLTYLLSELIWFGSSIFFTPITSSSFDLKKEEMLASNTHVTSPDRDLIQNKLRKDHPVD